MEIYKESVTAKDKTQPFIQADTPRQFSSM